MPMRFLYSMGVGGRSSRCAPAPSRWSCCRPCSSRSVPASTRWRPPACSATLPGGAPGGERRVVPARARGDAPPGRSRARDRRAAARDRLAGAAPGTHAGRLARAAGLLAAPPGGGSDHPRLRRERCADRHDGRARAGRRARRAPVGRAWRRWCGGPRRRRPARPASWGRRATSGATHGRSEMCLTAVSARPPTSAGSQPARPRRPADRCSWAVAPRGLSTRRPRSPRTPRWRLRSSCSSPAGSCS